MGAVDSDGDSPQSVLTSPRGEIIAAIRRLKRCDILIVGGGVHGAAFAHLAAFNGLRTVLLERLDYGAETSSRSSRMAHGGLRYLEFFDIPQVREGVRAREDLYRVAPHLARPTPFLIPVRRDRWWERLRFGAGLTCYDLLAPMARRHRWRGAQELDDEELGLTVGRYSGAYEYYDGILDDARLTLEYIMGARQEGALCLNHASVEYVTSLGAGPVTVNWRDALGGERHAIEAGVVVNCAGPWATELRGAEASTRGEGVVYSRGVHLLFPRRWERPALLLPLEGRARYYFVWPHPAGTLVGTTEREVPKPEIDPIPRPDELDELFARLDRDLPGAGLSRASAHFAYAGIRTIASGGEGRETVLRSRRPQWSFGRGVLTLRGGKLTTAALTALEGLRMVYSLANLEGRVVPLTGRALPGAFEGEGARAEFAARCRQFGISEEAHAYCADRLGGLVRFIPPTERSFTPVGRHLIRGAIEYVAQYEQGYTLEDVMWRRLGLAYLPGSGCDVVDEVASIVAACTSLPARERSDGDHLRVGGASTGRPVDETAAYRKRIAQITALLHPGAATV